MTNKEVIEDLKKSNEQLEARLKVEMMRMETAEIKETKYYIERNNLCIQALEQTQPQDDDLISRQAVINAFCNECDISSCPYRDKGKKYASCGYVDTLKHIPSVSQPKTGQWIEHDGWDGDVYYECSECKEPFVLIDGTPTDNLYNYCPNCGAYLSTMRTDREDGDTE